MESVTDSSRCSADFDFKRTAIGEGEVAGDGHYSRGLTRRYDAVGRRCIATGHVQVRVGGGVMNLAVCNERQWVSERRRVDVDIAGVGLADRDRAEAVGQEREFRVDKIQCPRAAAQTDGCRGCLRFEDQATLTVDCRCACKVERIAFQRDRASARCVSDLARGPQHNPAAIRRRTRDGDRGCSQAFDRSVTEHDTRIVSAGSGSGNVNGSGKGRNR